MENEFNLIMEQNLIVEIEAQKLIEEAVSSFQNRMTRLWEEIMYNLQQKDD